MDDNISKIVAQNAIIKKPENDPIADILQTQSNKSNVEAGFKSTEYGGTDLRSTVDISKYEKYMPYGITPVGMDVSILDKTRAQNQHWTEQLGLAAANQIPNIALGLVRDVGYLGAAISEWGDDRDYNNAMVRWADENKDKFTELFGWDAKIYAENPDETIDFNDFAWWLNQGRQLHEFASTMAIEGWGVGKLIGGGAKALGKAGSIFGEKIIKSAAETALKTGKTVSNSSKIFSKALSYSNKAADLAGKALTSSYLAHNEAAMMAGDVYKDLYAQYKGKVNQKTGRLYTEEELSHIASQGAVSTAMVATVIGTILNFPSMDLYMGGKKVTQGLNKAFVAEAEAVGGDLIAAIEGVTAKTKSIKKALNPTSKAMLALREFGTQGSEEIIQNHIQASGVRIGEKVAESGEDANFLSPLFELDKFVSDVWNKEGALAFISGGISGPVMAAQANALSLLTKTDVYDKNGKVTQKRITTNAAEKIQNENIFFNTKKDILEDLLAVKKASKEAMAIADGAEGSYENAVNKAFNVHLKQSIKRGVPDVLINDYKRIAQLDNTKVGDDGKTDAMRMGFAQKKDDAIYTSPHKQKANDAIETITYLAKEYESLANIYNEGEQAMYKVADDIYNLVSAKYLNKKSIAKKQRETSAFLQEHDIDADAVPIVRNSMLNEFKANPSELILQASINLHQTYLNTVDVKAIVNKTLENMSNETQERVNELGEQGKSVVLSGDKQVILDAQIQEQVELEVLDKVITEMHNYSTSFKGTAELLKNKKEADTDAVQAKEELEMTETKKEKKRKAKEEQDTLKKIKVDEDVKKAEKVEKAKVDKKAPVQKVELVDEPVIETQEQIETTESTTTRTTQGDTATKEVEKEGTQENEIVTKVINDLNTFLDEEFAISKAEKESTLDDFEKSVARARKFAALIDQLREPHPELFVNDGTKLGVKNMLQSQYEFIRERLDDTRKELFYEAWKQIQSAIHAMNNEVMTWLGSMLNNGYINPTDIQDNEPLSNYFTESNTASETDVKRVIGDYRNKEDKVESSARSIRYLGRNYSEVEFEVDGEKRIRFEEIEDVTVAQTADVIQKGDAVELVVENDYDGEVTDMKGNKEYIKNSKLYKNEKDAEADKDGIPVTTDRLPIMIIDSNSKQKIGYVTDTEWTQRYKRNIADKTDVATDLQLLKNLRKAIVKLGGKVKSKITNKKIGIPNTSKDGKLQSINNAVPNLSTQLPENQPMFAISRRGELVSSANIPITNKLANSHKYDLNKMSGMTFMVVPAANKELIAVPVVTPTLNNAHVDTVVNVVQTYLSNIWAREGTVESKKAVKETKEKIYAETELDLSNRDAVEKVLSNYVYLKAFNADTLMDKSNVGKVMVSLTPDNGTQTGVGFVVGIANTTEDYVLYYMNTDGTVSKQWKDGRSKATDKKAKEVLTATYLSELRALLAKVKMNVDVNKINASPTSYGNLRYDSATGEFRKIEATTYNAFLMDNLQTNLIEKKYTKPEGGESYHYTNQAVIEYGIDDIIEKAFPKEEGEIKIYEVKDDSSVIEIDKKEDVIEKPVTKLKSKKRPNAKKSDLSKDLGERNNTTIDKSEAISESETKELNTAMGHYVVPEFTYEQQSQIIDTIKFYIKDRINQEEDGSIKVDETMEYIKEQFQIEFDNLDWEYQQGMEVVHSMIAEGEYAADPDYYYMNNIKSFEDLELMRSHYKNILKNFGRLSEFTYRNIAKLGLRYKADEDIRESEDADNNDEVKEGIEQVDNSYAANYGKSSIERDTKDTATFKVKMLLGTVEDMRFVMKDGKRVKDETGKYVLVRNTNFLGLPSTMPFDTVYDEMQNTLNALSSVDNATKYEQFIEELKQSNKPYIYAFATKLEAITSDEVKSAFVNTMSMTKTNQETVVWSSRFVKNYDDVSKSYYEYSMTVMKTNKNSTNKVIRKQWWNNQILNQATNKLIKVDETTNEMYIDPETAKEWKALYQKNGNKLSDTEFLLLLDQIGIEFTVENLNILKEEAIIKKRFKHLDYKSYNDIFNVSNGFVKYIIDALNKGEKVAEKNEDTDSLDEGIDKLKLNNPLNILNTRTLDALANIISDSTNTYYSNSYKGGDGKTRYDITLNNYVSHRYDELMMKNSKILDDLTHTPFTGEVGGGKYNSLHLEKLVTGDKNFIQNYKITTPDTLRKKVKGQKGVLRPNMTDNELELHSMSLFFNSGIGNLKDKTMVSKFMPLVHSDKSSNTPILTTIKYHIDMAECFGIDGNFNENYSELGNTIYDYIIQGEVHRINDFLKKKTDGTITENNVGKQYYDGGGEFYFFPPFNTDERILALRNADGLVNVSTDSRKIMIEVAMELMKKQVKETKNAWINELGVNKTTTVKDKKGKEVELKQIHFIDKSYLNQLGKRTDEAKLDYAVWDFELNYFLANVNYIQMFAGDPALHNKNNDIDMTWGVVLKRMAKDIAPGKDGYWKDHTGRLFTKYGQLYIKDTKSKRYADYFEKLKVSGYKDTTGADAQEYTTLKERMIVMHAYSRISDDVYDSVMNKIYAVQERNVERLRKADKAGKQLELSELEDVELSPSEAKMIMQAEKPVYVNSKVNRDLGYNKVTYIKTSAFPLIPTLTKGMEIDKLRKQMEYMEVDQAFKGNPDYAMRATMVTGAKLGAVNVAKIFDLAEDNGLKVNDNNLRNVKAETLDRSGFRIQQEEPYDAMKKEILTVSQANKLLFEGLLAEVNGEAEYFNFKLGNQSYTARQLKAMKEKVRIQLFNKGKITLLKNLGATEIKTEDGVEYQFEDLTKLVKMLKDEAISRNYPRNEIDSLELTDDNKRLLIPIAFNNSSSRFESLMQSLITNNVTNQKIPGKSYVQGSGDMFRQIEDLSTEDYNNIAWTRDDIKRLNFVELRDKDDKLVNKSFDSIKKEDIHNYTVKAAQVIVPWKFRDREGKISNMKDFIKVENGKTMLDTTRVDSELLRLIGFRIPLQGHSSMLPIEIVGFHQMKSDLVIVPPEITNQMGADFDVDHLYTYSANTVYNMTKESRAEFKESIKNLKQTPEYISGEAKESYDNLISELDALYDQRKKFGGYGKSVLRSLITSSELSEDAQLMINEILNGMSEEDLSKLDKTKPSELKDNYKENTEVYAQLKTIMKEYTQVRKQDDTLEAISEDIEKLQSDLYKQKFAEFSKTAKFEINKVRYEINSLEDVEKLNKKQLQNLYVDVHWSVLTNPQVYKKVVSSLDMPELANIAKTLAKMEEQSSESVNIPISSRYGKKMYIANQAGKMGIAVESLASTFLSIIQDKDMFLSKLDEKSGKKVPSKLEVMVDGKVVNLRKLGRGGYTILVDVKDKNGKIVKEKKYISNADMTSMWQSESVDNANNLNLGSLHYNTITADVIDALNMLTSNSGQTMSLEQIVYFIKQESIVKYVKGLLTMNDTTKEFDDKISADDVYANLVAEYMIAGNVKEDAEPSTVILGEGALKDALDIYYDTSKVKSPAYYRDQLAVLEMFKHVRENIAQPIRGIQSALNFDTKGAGMDMLSSLDKVTKVNTNIDAQVSVSNASNLIADGSELGELYKDSILLANSLWGSVVGGTAILPFNTDLLNDTFNTIVDNMPNKELYMRDRQTIWKEMKKFIMNNETHGDLFRDDAGNVQSLTELRKSLLYDYGTNKSLSTLVNDAKKTEWGKKNVFLQRLETPMESIANRPKLVTYLADRGERIDESENTVFLLQLLTGSPEAQVLGEKLIQYAYLRGGVQDAESYLRYIPTQYLALKKMGQYLNNIQWNNSESSVVNKDSFIRQYYQHNPSTATKLQSEYVQVENKNSIKQYIYTDGKKTDKQYDLVDSFVLENPNGESTKTLALRIPSKVDKTILTYPKHLSYYNRDARRWLIYESIGESNSGKYTYVLLDNLGTEGLGFDEYNSSEYTSRSLLEENRAPMDDATYRKILDKKVVKQPVPNVEVSNPNKHGDVFIEYFGEAGMDNTYNKEQFINGLEKIAESDSKYAPIAKLLVENPNVFDGQLKVTMGKSKARGHMIPDADTKLAKEIDINPSNFFLKTNRTLDNPKFREEFEQVILHEATHALLSKYVRLYSNVATRSTLPPMVVQYFNKIDGIRNEIMDNFDAVTKAEYEQYKKNVIAEVGVTQDLINKYAGYKNIDEFIAYLMTEPIFQEELSKMKDKDGRNMLSRLIGWLSKIVRELMLVSNVDAVSDTKLVNAMSEVVNLIETVKREEIAEEYEESPEEKGGEVRIEPSDFIDDDIKDNPLTTELEDDAPFAIRETTVEDLQRNNGLLLKDGKMKTIFRTTKNYQMMTKLAKQINTSQFMYKAKVREGITPYGEAKKDVYIMEFSPMTENEQRAFRIIALSQNVTNDKINERKQKCK